MAKLKLQSIRDHSEGIIQQVDNRLVPKTSGGQDRSVAMACNFVFDKILGRGVLRKGTTKLGLQVSAGKECLGLYSHITSDGTSKIPLAVFNNVDDTNAILNIYKNNAWTTGYSSLTVNLPVRFETFLDTTLAVNGKEYISTEDGSIWVTSGGNLDVGNIPECNVIKEWQDKIFAAGDAELPDRLYYTTTPVDGKVEWKGDYIDIEPEEGAGAIVALAKTPAYILAFKQRSLKRWDGSSTYPESLIKIGTYSQECVTSARQSVYYFNKRGIFETTGSYPRKISRRIQDIIDAIPSENYTKVAAWSDEDHIYFSIGDITIGERIFYNCVIAYSLDSQIWTMLSFPTRYLRGGIMVSSDENEEMIVGDNDGNVWVLFDGNDDAGSQIEWYIRYQVQEFGSRGITKDLSKFIVYGNKMVGTVFGRADETGDFKPLSGNLNGAVNELIADLHGRYFEIVIQGKGRETEIIGIDFPEIDINENYVE